MRFVAVGTVVVDPHLAPVGRSHVRGIAVEADHHVGALIDRGLDALLARLVAAGEHHLHALVGAQFVGARLRDVRHGRCLDDAVARSARVVVASHGSLPMSHVKGHHQHVAFGRVGRTGHHGQKRHGQQGRQGKAQGGTGGNTVVDASDAGAAGGTAAGTGGAGDA